MIGEQAFPTLMVVVLTLLQPAPALLAVILLYLQQQEHVMSHRYEDD